MNNDNSAPKSDLWSDWLLRHRHGGDPNVAKLIRRLTENYADRVLSGVQINPGMTLLDIGTGDGLVALRAISRIGPSLQVILTDVSAPMLKHVEELTFQREVRNQCTFVECSADKLDGVADASVDIVTTRAVLAYVSDKVSAFREFFRVLKPGGHISICEPILRDDAFAVYALKQMLDAKPPEPRDLLMDLQYRIRSVQFPDTIEKISQSPITNYTERDLVRLAQGTGFSNVHLEFHIDTHPTILSNWETFLGTSPHPLAPPVRQIIAEHFTEEEWRFFEEKFRPIVEAGQSVTADRVAYLTARKPNFPR